MRFPQETSRESSYLGDEILQVQMLCLQTNQCQRGDYFACSKAYAGHFASFGTSWLLAHTGSGCNSH